MIQDLVWARPRSYNAGYPILGIHNLENEFNRFSSLDPSPERYEMKKGLIFILLLVTSMFAAIIIPRQQPKDAEEVDMTGEEGVSTPSTTEEATTEETPPEETGKTLRGVSLSPRSFEEQDFLEFFEKAQQAGAPSPGQETGGVWSTRRGPPMW